VDGDGDRDADVQDPADAILTAARYLCRSGAGEGPEGVRRALFAYNHAQWYVELVLSIAADVGQ
jgi:membrane-bound lytic murein transglycosylase B